MPASTYLKKSQPSIHQIQRLSCCLINPNSYTTTTTNPHHETSHAPKSRVRWISAISLGSGLGLIFYYSLSNPYSLKIPSLSFSGLSTVNDRKLFLHDYSSSFFLFGEAYRRKVFFNYEKRIRLRSPPEKVFEYFATYRGPDGELLMRPADLMRAVVPVFPPSKSNLVRDGYLRGERRPGDLRCDPSEFFMLFDVDNDGLISFKEYIFFVTLLSIPESSFLVTFKMFDIDNNGEIDKEEFKKVMALMRAHNRQGTVHRDGLRTGLKVCGSVENGGLVEYFFGKDGKARLQHDKFIEFMRGLEEEILRLEFAHYDYKSCQAISAMDFALSMVASADMSHLDRLLGRIDELNDHTHLRDIQITFEEFKNFAELRKKLLPFSLALLSYGKVNGLLTREDLKRAAYHVCGLPLSNNVVDIIFHLFDTNQDGNLSSDEFVRVLHKRERDLAQPLETWSDGAFGLLFQLCK